MPKITLHRTVLVAGKATEVVVVEAEDLADAINKVHNGDESVEHFDLQDIQINSIDSIEDFSEKF
jgi:hypothetical protein